MFFRSPEKAECIYYHLLESIRELQCRILNISLVIFSRCQRACSSSRQSLPFLSWPWINREYWLTGVRMGIFLLFLRFQIVLLGVCYLHHSSESPKGASSEMLCGLPLVIRPLGKWKWKVKRLLSLWGVSELLQRQHLENSSTSRKQQRNMGKIIGYKVGPVE